MYLYQGTGHKKAHTITVCFLSVDRVDSNAQTKRDELAMDGLN